MTASREERTYRSSCKKCVKGEARTRLMEDLLKKKIGLKDVEEYIIGDGRNTQGEGGKITFNSKIRKYEEERRIVGQMMRKKLRENGKNCTRLRRSRTVAEKNLMDSLGGRTRIFKKVVEDTRKNCKVLREELREKKSKKMTLLMT